MTPFGDYLERIRKHRRITQTKLASKLGVTPGYLSAIENGKKVPTSQDLLDQISNHLRLSSAEHQSLLEAHNQSKFVWRVPRNIRSEEYELVSDLWDHLGTLSIEKVETMKMLLRIGNEDKLRHRGAQATEQA